MVDTLAEDILEEVPGIVHRIHPAVGRLAVAPTQTGSFESEVAKLVLIMG